MDAPAAGAADHADERPVTGTLSGRLKLAFDFVLRGVAVGLVLTLLYAGWRNVSQAYDVWYYHLPFAARIGGLMDANAYTFSATNQARFEGFPLLAEVLQGAIWRVTGHIEATSLVSLGALMALPILLRRLFAVPLHLSLIAFVAIPLVLIHATSSYVDLPANICVTMLLLCIYRIIGVDREAPSPGFLVGCFALAAMAANMKFQLVPIVAIACVVLAIVSLYGIRSWSSMTEGARTAMNKRIAIVVIALPIVFVTPLQNLIVHKNPVWPVEMSVLGHSFPHVEEAYSQSPPHLANSPRPIRFIRSVLEIDNRPIATQQRWTLDQWAPASDPSCRMGGYFGAYVIANLIALAWAVFRAKRASSSSWRARSAGVVFVGVTAVVSLMPQSHELRYYMHWMLTLVSLNLVLWARDTRDGGRALIGLVATAALAVVTWSTNAAFLYASGSTFAQYRDYRVERRVLDEMPRGSRLCIGRPPFTFLYAPAFHPDKQYSVQEAAAASDCKSTDHVDYQP